ncbi:MAG: DUF1592 domain-containing protein [Myxococcales bacterium]|nr:DUF1592 domain-containing protein [Myxococcales bacterium]
MNSRVPRRPRALSLSASLTVLLALGTACTSSGTSMDMDDEDDNDNGGGTNGGRGGNGSGGNGNAGTSGNAGNGGGTNPGGGSGGMLVMPPPGVDACGALPPAPVRRLTRLEFAASAREIFPHAFTPDADGVFRLDNHRVEFVRPGAPQGAAAAKTHFIALGVPDPDTFGFENRAENLNPTPAKVESFTDLGVVMAELVTLPANLSKSLPCTDKTVACGRQVVDTLGPKFYRRPLTDAEKQRLYTFFEDEFNAAQSAGAGVDAFLAASRLLIEGLLQSPAFLYRLETGDESTKQGQAITLAQNEIAARLSYMFWHAGPDAELMTAAAEGKLTDPAEREKQARRLLADKRFRFTATEFFRQWADFEKIFSESYRLYPGRRLNERPHSIQRGLALSARYEAERFSEFFLADADGSLNTFFTSRKGWVNKYSKAMYMEGRLLRYDEEEEAAAGAPIDSYDFTDPNYQPIDNLPENRQGFLTRLFFPWAYSHFSTPNPPARGSFMMSKLFCRSLGTPPADALERAAEAEGSGAFPESGSNREQFIFRVKDSPCISCHTVLDPPGFAFENYNDFGQYITKDDNNPSKTVDASGVLGFGTDIDGPFQNAVDLTKKLATSETVRQCIVSQFYEYVTGRTAAGNLSQDDPDSEGVDVCRVRAMDKAVKDAGGDLREGLVQYVKSADFIWRPAY